MARARFDSQLDLLNEQLKGMATATESARMAAVEVLSTRDVDKAREILASGEMGRVLLVHGNYMQEFNAFPAPLDWRYDEKLAGSMRAVSEIGSHWLDLAAFLTGLEPEAVSASFGRESSSHEVSASTLVADDVPIEKQDTAGAPHW